MRYRYRALGSSGELITGEIESQTARAAGRQLLKQGLTLLALDEITQQSTALGQRHKAIKAEESRLALHQLVTLLKAGVTLDEAVNSLAESLATPALCHAFSQMGTLLRRGEPFSKALSDSALKLPPYLYQLAEAGELTGNLAEALAEGVEQMSYDHQIATEMRNALIYPSILIVSGIGAVVLIFIMVVPKFANLLEKSQGEIPFLAEAVLQTGLLFNQYSDLILALALIAVMGAAAALGRAEIRLWLLNRLMGLPLIGSWLREADSGRWAAMMATLLSSRVELIEALELSRRSVVGSRLRANLSQVTKSVKGGGKLADALKESGAISATGYGLVRVGERSGELATMLRSLATLYSESGRNRMKRFLTLLEPIAILTIGAVIGLIMTGIILAITSVNDISI
ncbi:type II secretion system F family protein [Ectothiorhodospiraceae bacterium BW-2]|nr:type II secretion system F family protein [Ectothiorhodospiraceae bacterium BW-2]